MKTFPIAKFNGFRGANELVVYEGSGHTGTNNYGLEACVLDGRVIRYGKNNNEIPEGGYVLSGHGSAARFIADAICIGAKIILDRENMLLSSEVDQRSLQLNAEKKIHDVTKRFDECIADKVNIQKEKAAELIAQAKTALAEQRFADVDLLTEEAYYYTARSVSGEIRGVWHRPHEHSEEEVEQTILKFKDAGFNLMLVETNYEGYANAQKCVHDYLPIRKRYEDGFDVIESLIRNGKKHGIKIHAWFEDFFYGVRSAGCPMAEVHPEWMACQKDGSLLLDAYDDFYFLNPALPEVQELLLNSIKELLDQYEFDGLQLDYIRYPVIHGIEHSAGFEPVTKEMFKKDTGIDVDSIPNTDHEDWTAFTAWRAEKITSYVKKVYDMICEYRANGRDITLSTAVFGNPDEAIRLKCQDWRYWVKQGWLDAIYPMAYLNAAEDVGAEVAYMVQNYGEAPNISGIAPMYNHLPTIESTKQVEECRKAGAVGVAFFATGSCTPEQLEKLKIGVFRNR